MNNEWEEYHIKITTPKGEDKASYREKEGDRGSLTDQFEGELYALVQKYNSYGKNLGLKIEAVTSEDQPIHQY